MADMTLEEALAAATVDEELVTPVNEVLMINPETRTINVPDSEKLFGARQDMGVERKYFKCPRIVGDNIDLSQHRIFVNYVPSKQDGTYNSEDDVQGYWCEDLAVEGDHITFSWKLSENVTRNAGYIAFAVYAKTIDEYGNLRTKWHTTIAVGNVLDTLPDGEEWVTVYPDIVMQLLERMDKVEKIATPETLLDRTLKDSTKAAPADIVGKLFEEKAELKGDLVNNIYSMRVEIEQGYYAIVDGTKTESTTWCRTKSFVNIRYIIESSYRMYVCAFQNGVYIGTWNGSDFIKTFDNTLYIHSVDFNELSKKYGDYQFTINFYDSGNLFSKENVYSDLKITNYEDNRTDAIENEIKEVKNKDILELDKKMANIMSNVIFVNHRGFNTVAPENTIPAFELSAKEGFVYVETDVLFTSDDVPVLLHDGTINRTARNTDGTELSSDIAIRDITYQQALTYDFGIWKSDKYKGTNIPTFDEFMAFCKSKGLKPFIELKDEVVYTESMVNSIIDIVKKYGMIDNVWFISFSYDNLLMVKNILPSAKLGLTGGWSATRDEESFMSVINQIKALRTDTNTVAMSGGYAYFNETFYNLCVSNDVPLIMWTVDTKEAYNSLYPCFFAILSNCLSAYDVN